jgi:hypothetical protein
MPETKVTDIPLLRGPVPLSHLILGCFLRPGDFAVDATCGNGNDTLLLARLAGPDGRVWAFDIQADAIDRTTTALQEAGLLERVTLLNSGHETMRDHVVFQVSAVVFNLGYLPGGDRTVITRPESTLTGLTQAAGLLAPRGIIAITVYPGHTGGDIEQATVEEWASRLTPGSFHVWHMGQRNVTSNAPCLILIQKAP